MADQESNQTNKSESPPKITNRKMKHRRIAQLVIEGKPYTEIAAEVTPNAKYPRQTIYESVQQPGVQAEIRKELEKADYDKSDIREVIALVMDAARERAREKGDLTQSQARVVEIAARTEAMLTDRQIVENVPSSDDLVKKAEDAIDRLKHDTMPRVESDSQITSIPLSTDKDNVAEGSVQTQGKTNPTPSGKSVEATPGGERENN